MLWSKFFFFPLFAIFSVLCFLCFWKRTIQQDDPTWLNDVRRWNLPRFEARRGPGSPAVAVQSPRESWPSTGLVGGDWKVYGTMEFWMIWMIWMTFQTFHILGMSWSQVTNSYYQTVLVTICIMLDTD
jgi:hypothetical protein